MENLGGAGLGNGKWKVTRAAFAVFSESLLRIV